MLLTKHEAEIPPDLPLIKGGAKLFQSFPPDLPFDKGRGWHLKLFFDIKKQLMIGIYPLGFHKASLI